MTAVLITIIAGIIEIADQLFGVAWQDYQAPIEIFLAAVTPLLVWFIPKWTETRWPLGG